MDDREEFERIWTQVEARRIRRKPEPEDKLHPLFKRGFASTTDVYIFQPRGFVWCCWSVSNHVNAAGYHLMWRVGRKTKSYELVKGKYQAAKSFFVLKRRAEKYRAESFAKLVGKKNR